MSEIDLKLKLLAGEPLKLEEVGFIYPLTLREIAKIGYIEYTKMIYLFQLSVKDLISDETVEIPEELNLLNALDLICHGNNKELQQYLTTTIGKLMREEDVYLSISLNCVFLGGAGSDRVITRENFGKLKELIEYQNSIRNIKSKENPANDKAQAIIDKLKKAREKIAKANSSSNESDKIEFTDIISSVSTKSNTINKLNVWDLTVYQLYDEHRRLEAISQYDLNVQSLMHGASSQDVDLKHWSRKLD